MVRVLRWGISLVLLLGFSVLAQAQETYLDEFLVHVKPDKRAAFDATVKKMVAANRGGQGDNWVTLESTYGDTNLIRLVSTRSSFADIDKGNASFDAAMEKAMGRAAMEKLFEDFGSVSNESSGLLLRRRPDLSANMPSDPAGQAKIVGSTRWVRLIRIVVRIGQGPRFEELAKQVKAAEEKTSPNIRSWISQSVAGDRASVYYVAELQPSLAGFDSSPSVPQLLGNDAYQALLKTASEVIQTEEITLNRFLPELSNPPADTVKVAPDYWNPKPAAPKPAASKPAAKTPAKTTP
jgi:hypothetical protein